MNRSWVDFVIAHRKRVLAAWVLLFLLAASRRPTSVGC
jgi:hypothetical protein